MYSKNISFKQKTLKIYEIISIEIFRRFNLYTLNQKKNFKVAVDLIDQLDAYLELLKELDYSYFNKLKELFQLLKRLHVKQLIITIVANSHSKNCIFVNFKPEVRDL